MYTLLYFKNNRRFQKTFKTLDDLYRYSQQRDLSQFFIQELITSKSEYRIYVGD